MGSIFKNKSSNDSCSSRHVKKHHAHHRGRKGERVKGPASSSVKDEVCETRTDDVDEVVDANEESKKRNGFNHRGNDEREDYSCESGQTGRTERAKDALSIVSRRNNGSQTNVSCSRKGNMSILSTSKSVNSQDDYSSSTDDFTDEDHGFSSRKSRESVQDTSEAIESKDTNSTCTSNGTDEDKDYVRRRSTRSSFSATTDRPKCKAIQNASITEIENDQDQDNHSTKSKSSTVSATKSLKCRMRSKNKITKAISKDNTACSASSARSATTHTSNPEDDFKNKSSLKETAVPFKEYNRQVDMTNDCYEERFNTVLEVAIEKMQQKDAEKNQTSSNKTSDESTTNRSERSTDTGPGTVASDHSSESLTKEELQHFLLALKEGKEQKAKRREHKSDPSHKKKSGRTRQQKKEFCVVLPKNFGGYNGAPTGVEQVIDKRDTQRRAKLRKKASALALRNETIRKLILCVKAAKSTTKNKIVVAEDFFDELLSLLIEEPISVGTNGSIQDYSISIKDSYQQFSQSETLSSRSRSCNTTTSSLSSTSKKTISSSSVTVQKSWSKEQSLSSSSFASTRMKEWSRGSAGAGVRKDEYMGYKNSEGGRLAREFYCKLLWTYKAEESIEHFFDDFSN